MTHIKIEVPANDHIALSAMAEALNRIAAERVSSIPVRGESHCVAPDVLKNFEVYEPFDADSEIDESEDTVNELQTVKVEQDDILDADGLPWDNRIHSRGKTRLSDDTWRLARKPNDKTDEEWSAYVESVKSELKAVQDIPVTPPEADFTEQQPVDIVEPTLDEQAVADLTPPVTPVTPPTSLTLPVVEAPVTPPTSLTPPVVEAPVASNQPSVTTFQELMLYITGNAKKRGADNELIKSTLLEVDPALVAIPLIATRADLIPKFVTALEAKLS